jgi:hypothetical protein
MCLLVSFAFYRQQQIRIRSNIMTVHHENQNMQIDHIPEVRTDLVPVSPPRELVIPSRLEWNYSPDHTPSSDSLPTPSPEPVNRIPFSNPDGIL